MLQASKPGPKPRFGEEIRVYATADMRAEIMAQADKEDRQFSDMVRILLKRGLEAS